MRLTVIILSYNTRELLRQCLRSVISAAALQREPLTIDVMVVDNASPDGSVEMVAAEFPQVYLVASPNNLGYTGGNNLALQLLGLLGNAASSALPGSAETSASSPSGAVEPLTLKPAPCPDFVLLLNADTEIVGDALWRMATFLQEHPHVGGCGANLRYGDGQFQHGAFHFPSLFQVALDFFPLAGWPGAHRLHNSRLNGRYPASLWQGTAPFPVDFVLGAAMMVRGAALQQVGGLDDAFFMYCEEMDWCLRLAEAGWPIYAVPTAQVIHYEGQSSRQVRWAAYERLWRSRFRFYAKHHSRYPAAYRALVRLLVRSSLLVKKQSARRRFATGQITGDQVQAELAAYRAVAQL